MLVPCWQHIWQRPSRPLVPVTGTTPSSHSSLENMKPSAVSHRPMATLDWRVLASYWLRSARTGCAGLAPPQLLQLRSSCRGYRQPPPSSAFVQVAAGIATSLPPTCLLFCKYNVSPWEINKLTSTPERAGGFRRRGKNHLPSSYLKRLKRVKKLDPGCVHIQP